MKRRDFLSKSVLGGTAAAAASALAAPAIAQQVIEWRMVHSWPKGLPGVGVGAERLAARIEAMSGGRMKITVFAAGELVPALGCMDAVMDGTAEMGHDASFYHVGKHPMLAAFFAVPFGMTADEQAAWLLHGGGQALWDELNDQFGIISIPAGQTVGPVLRLVQERDQHARGFPGPEDPDAGPRRQDGGEAGRDPGAACRAARSSRRCSPARSTRPSSSGR